MENYNMTFKRFVDDTVESSTFPAETLENAKKQIEGFFRIFMGGTMAPDKIVFEWETEDNRVFNVSTYQDSVSIYTTLLYRGYVMTEAQYQAALAKQKQNDPLTDTLKTMDLPTV